MDKNEIDIEMGKKFNSAAAFVTGASQYGNTKISQSDQLKLYGFYKQSTCFGDFASTFKPEESIFESSHDLSINYVFPLSLLG